MAGHSVYRRRNLRLMAPACSPLHLVGDKENVDLGGVHDDDVVELDDDGWNEPPEFGA